MLEINLTQKPKVEPKQYLNLNKKIFLTTGFLLVLAFRVKLCFNCLPKKKICVLTCRINESSQIVFSKSNFKCWVSNWHVYLRVINLDRLTDSYSNLDGLLSYD